MTDHFIESWKQGYISQPQSYKQAWRLGMRMPSLLKGTIQVKLVLNLR